VRGRVSRANIVNPITDDIELAEALMEIVQAHFAV